MNRLDVARLPDPETPVGGRNHRLVAAWLRCGRDLGDDLPRALVRAELTMAGLAAGLDEQEIRRTLRDDLAEGKRAASRREVRP
ncbi:MAG TPA: hypothetical protein VFG23_18885 [Polyangia bacterium]|nr:hypothetical protein [Polyangia bacterium]